ncbi:MAG: hypothetical protein LBN39_09080 [Planctomycetaceae bacterium]|nr:hypothetical protein [Planctomycetaceae bacterium]
MYNAANVTKVVTFGDKAYGVILTTVMRYLFLSLFLFLPFFGCTQQPDVSRSQYGTIVRSLPLLDDAEKPFIFPYAGDNDHRHCEFPDDDLF